ncbi:MAG: helix-turn-helix transcriptional regulator [Lachnospiraceae bacterium]|nr:helix-turn-helix transcriptional regulator [Lachnospiraceae bacterium]
MEHSAIGESRRLIKNNKMKIAEVQAVFGFNTPQAIYKWMRGDSIPTIDNIVILADMFGVGIEDIVVVSRRCA